MANEVRIKLTAEQKAKIKSATGKVMNEIRVGSLGNSPAVSAPRADSARAPRAAETEALSARAPRTTSTRAPRAAEAEALSARAPRTTSTRAPRAAEAEAFSARAPRTTSTRVPRSSGTD